MKRFMTLLLSLMVLSGAAAAQQTPVSVSAREAGDHLQHPIPVVRSDWAPGRDFSAGFGGDLWRAMLIVGPDGHVSEVQILDGPESNRDRAVEAARRTRFTPFSRDGHPVTATVEHEIVSFPSDYVGPADRDFPTDVDLSSVRIRLSRGQCLGTCPSFEVEVSGDGAVIYNGRQHVIFEGQHQWRISDSDVQALLALIRRADYFRLAGWYAVGVPDLPGYFTSVEIGAQRKFVFDYFGEGYEAALRQGYISGPSFEGFGGPMPHAVTEIEDAIERLSGASSRTEGDERTMDVLRAENYDFRGASAQAALQRLLIVCNVDLARQFLAAGARAAPDDLRALEACSDRTAQ